MLRSLFLLFALGCLLAAHAQVEEADVCVYGGTSAGVIAAAQAARMGRDVVLVEPGRHLGGMSSSGLGWTDNGSTETIGGMSREFYRRVYRFYTKADAWMFQTRKDYLAWLPKIWGVDGPRMEQIKAQFIFEPHAAEAVFDDLVREARVRVVFGERLDLKNGVRKDGAAIVAARMESGREFRAKMFIDATYEGDLLSRAGVKTIVGRESNEQYGETLNGAFPFTPAPFPKIDPFVVPGDPKSGLLPRIEAKPPGPKGAADHRVQAYNFRICITDVPENRVPLTKPAAYNALDYELLARHIANMKNVKPGPRKHAAIGLRGNGGDLGINCDADAQLKKLAKTELEGCALAQSLADSLPKESVFQMTGNVNSPHADFSPIPVSDDRLIFGSVRTKTAAIYTIEEYDSLPAPKRKLYLAKKNGETWEFNGVLDETFDDPAFDIANGTFSQDSSRFYFTKCAENWQYKMICQIYVTKYKNGKWSKPELLDENINLSNSTASHPTMGRESKRNREIMYFVSDREGTKGGMDIWFAEYDEKKKTFRKPRNAGTKINTVGEEMTPYYDLGSKTLYYSSNGKPNIGGLDVFSASGEASTWSDSKNLGFPINSGADDLDFALKPSGKGGFIISNRKGANSLYHETCCDDIYEFSYLSFITTICVLKVEDDETKDCLTNGEQINVYIEDENGKLLSQTTSSTKCGNELNLRPGFDYVIEVKKDGHFTQATKVSTKNVKGNTIIPATVSMRKKPLAPIVLKNVQFEFGSAVLTAASKKALDTTIVELFKRNPDIVIELSAHTDNKGSDDFNMKLSQRRAESVVNYLISQGIREELLVAKGYGETMPVAPNTNPDGSDNPAGRELNRRTEVKIIGDYNISDEEDEEEVKPQRGDKKIKF